MRVFRFRLERVMRWRRAELEIEEFRLKHVLAELNRLDQAKMKLETDREGARRRILTQPFVDGQRLATLAAYLDRLNRTERDLIQRRAERERQLAEQQHRLLEARRRFRLLEKLRQRRWEEWLAELNRDQEDFASEAYLAQWSARLAKRSV